MIQLNNVKQINNDIKSECLIEINRFFREGDYILNKDVSDFEDRFAKSLNADYCVGVSSGADGLYAALLALGIGQGDEVITQGTAYNASVTSILRVGAKPVFVDINHQTWTIDLKAVEKAITYRTRAIMPVHLYGNPCDLTELQKLSIKHSIPFLEDACQAYGAKFNGKEVGTFGKIGVFSFYPTKPLGGVGDAGAVITSDRGLYEKLLAIRNLGKENGEHTQLGYNLRMDAIQAIVLSFKLGLVREDIGRRKLVAEKYRDLPVGMPRRLGESSYHLFPIWVKDRNKLIAKFKEKGIEYGIHYPSLVYQQPFWQGEYNKCPVSEEVISGIISIPIHSGLSDKDIKKIKKVINEVCGSSPSL